MGWEYGSLADARDIANRNMFALRSVGERECGTSAASGFGAAPTPGSVASSPGPRSSPLQVAASGGGGGGGGTPAPHRHLGRRRVRWWRRRRSAPRQRRRRVRHERLHARHPDAGGVHLAHGADELAASICVAAAVARTRSDASAATRPHPDFRRMAAGRSRRDLARSPSSPRRPRRARSVLHVSTCRRRRSLPTAG